MMKSLLIHARKTISRFSKIIIWIGSIIFIALLLIQLSVLAGVIWMNSSNGQDFIKAKIDTATNTTGYTIEYVKTGYAFPQGLTIKGLEIADSDGSIIDINKIVIRPSLLGLGIRHFGLSTKVDTFTLHRLPQTRDDTDAPEINEAFGLKPFSLPDIYIQSFALNNLSIKKLNIKEDVIGTPLSFSPRLYSNINLGDVIDLNLKLDINEEDAPLPPWFVKKVNLQGQFDPKSLDLVINEFSAQNAHLNAAAQGQANLSQQGQVDLAAEAKIANISAFSKDLKGQAQMKMTLSGAVNSLSIASEGNISLPMLKDRGLDNIVFKITDNDISTAPLGRAFIKTQYQDKPIELNAMFNLDNNVFSIEDIKGSAPDLTLDGSIKLNAESSLASGNLMLSAQNIKTYSALAGVDIDGSGTFDLTLADDNSVQRAVITSTINNAIYEEIKLQNANLMARIDNIERPFPNKMVLKASNLRLTKDAVFQSIASNITQREDGAYLLSLSANGRAVQSFKIEGNATLTGLQQSQISADNIDFKLSSKGSAIVLKGKADTQNIDVTLQTKNFNLSSIPVALPNQMRDLKLDADGSVKGAMIAPVIIANAHVGPVKVIKNSRVKISANGRYDKNLATVKISGNGDNIDTLQGNIELPFELSLYPFVLNMPQDTPLKGDIDIRAQARSIAPLILPVGHKLTGDIVVDGRIAGNLGNPDISGGASLSDGTYIYNAFGVELFDIALNADLTPDSAILKKLNANDGKGGELSGSGKISFTNPQNTNLDLQISDFKLLDSDKAKGMMSANLDFQGLEKDYLLSGSVTLGQFDIIIPERFQSTIPELNVVTKSELERQKQNVQNINLDIKVKADNRIFVRGWGLDAEFGGEIDVDGTLDDPQLNGAFSSRRGRYEEFGRRFTLERAYLRFLGSAPPSPYLDILATTDADDIKASVNLSGEVGDPTIKLSSVPALPEDEVMSHILFGENLSRITPFQAIQLKQTLDRFTGKGGGFNALGKLRDLTGLDDIRIDTDDEGQASVGVGKYLTEDVYLELEKGAGESSGAAKVQVEVTPDIKLESEIGQDAEAGAGVIWKWDY